MARHNELPEGFAADVVTLLALCEAVEGAATPAEKQRAVTAAQAEGARQLEACLERQRQRILTDLKFRAVLGAAGEDY